MLLRAGYYRRIAQEVGTGKSDLSATECYCLELLMLMEHPTVSRLAAFMGMSKPSTSYRVGHLIEKGYLQKVPSDEDRRESLLVVTEKYAAYYGSQNPEIGKIIKTIEASFTEEELVQLTGMMNRISGIIETMDRTGDVT